MRKSLARPKFELSVSLESQRLCGARRVPLPVAWVPVAVPASFLAVPDGCPGRSAFR